MAIHKQQIISFENLRSAISNTQETNRTCDNAQTTIRQLWQCPDCMYAVKLMHRQYSILSSRPDLTSTPRFPQHFKLTIAKCRHSQWNSVYFPLTSTADFYLKVLLFYPWPHMFSQQPGTDARNGHCTAHIISWHPTPLECQLTPSSFSLCQSWRVPSYSDN